jgi:hypothetical protein
VARKNSDGAKAALARAADHYARAIIELKGAGAELARIRGYPTGSMVNDEGLRYLRDRQRELLDRAKQDLGLSLRSETPEEGP